MKIRRTKQPVLVLALAMLAGAAHAENLEYCHKGVSARKAKNYDLALDYFMRCIEAGNLTLRTLATVYLKRGLAYQDTGRHDRAITEFSSAIRVQPDSALPYYNRGLSYGNKRQYDRAIADYDTAIRLKPDLADAYYNRGIDYKNKRQYDRAIADFDTAIRLKPDLSDAYIHRGHAYEKQGWIETALGEYRRAYDLGNRNEWMVKKLKQHGRLP